MHNSLLLAASLLIITSTSSAFGQIDLPPYKEGEVTEYKVTWKKFITAGFLTNEVVSLDPRTGKAKFKSTAKTSSFVDNFYKVRYTFFSFFDLHLHASNRFEMDGSEKDEFKKQTETFNYANNQGTLLMTIDQPRDGKRVNLKTLNPPAYSLNDSVQDILSMMYAVRSTNLPIVVGQETTLKIVYEGEIWSSTLKCIDLTIAKVEGTRYSAQKYQMTNVSPSGEVNSATQLTIADDDAKTLTEISSEIKIGKVFVSLSKRHKKKN